jgi:hypothetical protein
MRETPLKFGVDDHETRRIILMAIIMQSSSNFGS